MSKKRLFIVASLATLGSLVLLIALFIYDGRSTSYLLLPNSDYNIKTIASNTLTKDEVAVYQKYAGPVVVGDESIYVIRIGFGKILPYFYRYLALFTVAQMLIFAMLVFMHRSK